MCTFMWRKNEILLTGNLADRCDDLDVSIIIVSYNTREMTVECIRSVLEQTSAIRYEVIVVDNASMDVSAEAIRTNFPNIKLIALAENLGFGRANNLAVTHARGRRILCSTRTPSFWIMRSTICTRLPLRNPNAASGAVVPCLPTAR